MKIAIVLDDTLDSTDGVQQVLLEISRELVRRGNEVHFLTSTTERTDVPHVHSLAKNLRFRFNGNRVGIPLPGSKRAIRKVLAEEQYDVIHVSIPHSPLLAGRVVSSTPAHTPVVGTFMILPLGFLSKWGGKLLGVFQRLGMRRFHELMAVSAPAAEFSRFMYGRPGVVTGNPVNVAPFVDARESALASPCKNQPVKVLFLGRLVERKGAGELLRALPLVRKLTQTEFSVEIAGRGPLLKEYQQFVRSENLEDVVSFSGFIPEEKKADLLAQADIIALPAYGGESFGISVVEALAASTGALIAGDNPGYASTLGELRECLIDPKDTQAFAHRLKKLIDSPNYRKELSRRQVEQARLFDTPRVVDKVEQVYTDALAAAKTTKSSR